MKTYKVIGVMSGTSLDGIDIAYCEFINENNGWRYKIIDAETIPYSFKLKNKLSNAIDISGSELMLLNNLLGNLIGSSIVDFIKKYQINKNDINLIASHGHTIFHQPQNKLTTQIGSGANISSITGLPVVCDFRTIDVSLSGNGAPLVPIGDSLLFQGYDFCMNIGGIANVSYKKENQLLAFDVCPANIILNKYAGYYNLDYDKNGELAQQGKLNTELLNQLNNLDYYFKSAPKSLGIEWIKQKIYPIFEKTKIDKKDILNTFCEHIAIQTGILFDDPNKKVLVTGGGAYNSYLINRIQHFSKSRIIVPDKKTVEFKEALIFALLGVLRFEKKINCYSSVTGSKTDNIGGCIYQAFP